MLDRVSARCVNGPHMPLKISVRSDKPFDAAAEEVIVGVWASSNPKKLSLPEAVAEAVQRENLTVAAVLSGNRNFEGRINAQVKANYLASPPLVVAYALAGRIDIDLTTEPLGEDSAGAPVYLRDIWPSDEEVRETVRTSIRRDMFQHEYKKAFEGDANWQTMPVPTGDMFVWDPQSTYIKRPPYFDHMVDPETSVQDLRAMRLSRAVRFQITGHTNYFTGYALS